MTRPSDWIIFAIKLAACYYFAGFCVLVLGLILHYTPNPHIYLGIFWLAIPLVEPYESIVKVFIASSPLSSGGVVEAVEMLLLFLVAFYAMFRLLNKKRLRSSNT